MLLLVVVIFILGGVGILAYKIHLLNKLQYMSSKQMIEYTTRNIDNVRITVGIIKDGKASFTVYGKNGVELPQEDYLYEIGSITKTFDAALICKAVKEGKLQLEDTIDQYLKLPPKDHYPTILELVTHTSGYDSFYFESEMIKNHLTGRNDFYGISKDQILKRVREINLKDGNHSFKYSNFGMAVIGLVLEQIYQQDYTELMNHYVQYELNMKATSVSTGSDNGEKFWAWKKDDGYIPAGAIVSDISDMLAYAQLQMEEVPEYLKLSHQIRMTINAGNYIYDKLAINLDQIAVNWIYDKKNQLYWHNGGTGDYNSYMCFNPEEKIAVVVLSNQKPFDRIPATAIGFQVMKENR